MLASGCHEVYDENVREHTTCRSCGRTIAPDYRFCPYCGTERVRSYEFRQLLDQSFDGMDHESQAYTMQWLIRLEERVLALENDLDTFLSPTHRQ